MIDKVKAIIQGFGYNLVKPLIHLKLDKNPIHLHQEASVEDSYNHFKEQFSNAMLFQDSSKIRDYCISKAIQGHEETDLFLEFGVFKARTTNQFAKHLNKQGLTLFGFDSFMGLSEDWTGSESSTKGTFSLNGKLPMVDSNVFLNVGLVDKTLFPFLQNNPNKHIQFMHMDLDTYTPTKYVLEETKKYCKRGTIILFDELYGYPGWREHEFKALNEVYDRNEYIYIAFSKFQVGISIT